MQEQEQDSIYLPSIEKVPPSTNRINSYFRQMIQIKIHVFDVPENSTEYPLGRNRKISGVELVADRLRAKPYVACQLLGVEHAFFG